jgi:MFS family permease
MTPLLVLACVIGIASVLFDVSWMCYVPTLVKDRRHYVEASAKLGMSSSAADVAGPGLAGLLVSALTAPIAMLADAFSYLVSVASLVLIRPKRQPARMRSNASRTVVTAASGTAGAADEAGSDEDGPTRIVFRPAACPPAMS